MMLNLIKVKFLGGKLAREFGGEAPPPPDETLNAYYNGPIQGFIQFSLACISGPQPIPGIACGLLPSTHIKNMRKWTAIVKPFTYAVCMYYNNTVVLWLSKLCGYCTMSVII